METKSLTSCDEVVEFTVPRSLAESEETNETTTLMGTSKDGKEYLLVISVGAAGQMPLDEVFTTSVANLIAGGDTVSDIGEMDVDGVPVKTAQTTSEGELFEIGLFEAGGSVYMVMAGSALEENVDEAGMKKIVKGMKFK